MLVFQTGHVGSNPIVHIKGEFAYMLVINMIMFSAFCIYTVFFAHDNSAEVFSMAAKFISMKAFVAIQLLDVCFINFMYMIFFLYLKNAFLQSLAIMLVALNFIAIFIFYFSLKKQDNIPLFFQNEYKTSSYKAFVRSVDIITMIISFIWVLGVM